MAHSPKGQRLCARGGHEPGASGPPRAPAAGPQCRPAPHASQTLVTDGVESIIIHGMDRWDGLGFSVLIADVNGDGSGDLLLGAMGGDGSKGTEGSEATSKVHGAGEVHVIFGHQGAWEATVHLEVGSPSLRGHRRVRIGLCLSRTAGLMRRCVRVVPTKIAFARPSLPPPVAEL